MFTIEMLPARQGDCLWIEYGKEDDIHRVLIDGGAGGTQRDIREKIETLDVDDRRFELLVVTHIDSDHIAGILRLLRDPPEGLVFGDVWFNAWDQIVQAKDSVADRGVLGPKQGERLTALLTERGYTWNAAFGGGPAARAEGDDLPQVTLAGGLTLTLLTPTLGRLAKMHKVWRKKIEALGLEPGRAGWELEGLRVEPEGKRDRAILGGSAPIDIVALGSTTSDQDDSEANGSSIALLATFGGARCLLAADAFPSDLTDAIDVIEGEGQRISLDAFKLSHHGGQKNTSAALLRRLDCPRYLVSTNGSYHDHPNPETIARVLVHGRAGGDLDLYFNYSSDETKVWNDRALKNGSFPYTTHYGDVVSLGK